MFNYKNMLRFMQTYCLTLVFCLSFNLVQAKQIEITVNNARVRTQNAQGKVLTHLNKGTKVIVLESQVEGSIVQISENQVGWVSKQVYKEVVEEGTSTLGSTQPNQSEALQLETGAEQLEIIVANARVRLTPLLGKIIGAVHQGERYPIIEQNQVAARIKMADGQMGWVANSLFKLVKTTQTPQFKTDTAPTVKESTLEKSEKVQESAEPTPISIPGKIEVTRLVINHGIQFGIVQFPLLLKDSELKDRTMNLLTTRVGYVLVWHGLQWQLGLSFIQQNEKVGEIQLFNTNGEIALRSKSSVRSSNSWYSEISHQIPWRESLHGEIGLGLQNYKIEQDRYRLIDKTNLIKRGQSKVAGLVPYVLLGLKWSPLSQTSLALDALLPLPNQEEFSETSDSSKITQQDFVLYKKANLKQGQIFNFSLRYIFE